jgi:acetyl esterase
MTSRARVVLGVLVVAGLAGCAAPVATRTPEPTGRWKAIASTLYLSDGLIVRGLHGRECRLELIEHTMVSECVTGEVTDRIVYAYRLVAPGRYEVEVREHARLPALVGTRSYTDFRLADGRLFTTAYPPPPPGSPARYAVKTEATWVRDDALTNPAPARLSPEPLSVRTLDVEYLTVGGHTFAATVYQPEGPGPFPAVLDVHGGAWTREDVRRDEHAQFDRALAGLGLVVVAVDYRQSPTHRYPDSVADVNYAIRWLRANARRFKGSPRLLGVFASSSGAHLVLLNAMRPAEARYAATAVAGVPAEAARPDYVVAVYPISDPAARRAYAASVGSTAPVRSTDIYFAPPNSLEEGNPQRILERGQAGLLPPVLLIQGSPDAGGVMKDKNVSVEIQQRFAASYRAGGGALQLELLPGAPHNFVNAPGPHAERALALIRIFIERQLAGG